MNTKPESIVYLDDPCPHCGHLLLRIIRPHAAQCDLCGAKYAYRPQLAAEQLADEEEDGDE